MEENEKIAPMKRTSSEQRKLRSRDAARCRRSKETEVFYELARTLPLPRRVSTQLDKAAIMRVALSFLSLQRLLRPETKNQKMETEEKDEEEEEDPMDTFYPQVLAGFVLVMSEEGDMIYLTENVSKHIGITQLELLGQSIYDFVHPCDQEELRDLLAPRPGLSKKPGADQSSERNFFMRMKSTLTSRGRTVNIKSADWKVLHCTGHMRPLSCGSTSPPTGRVMTLLCEPIPHPSSVEFPLDTHTFLSRHSMDLRFTHCEGRVMELTGYRPDDLIGCSAYEFHHALDSDHVNKSLHTLLSKGQVSTSCYRFMANGGGFVWAQTQATVLYNSKTSHPEAVVCLNFILSGVQQPDVVFSIEQIRSSRSSQAEPDTREDVTPCDITDCDGERPHSSGEKPDCDCDLFSKLKEEPEELLQVASAAGETLSTLTGDSAELSFYSPLTPDSVPEHPQDLCSPKLRQLLAPIFDPFTPPSSTSSSPPPSLSPASSPEPHPSTDDSVDTSEVEKFFAVCSVDDVKTDEILEGMDLDMLAPYISMDDDFQLTFLGSNLTEKAEKPLLTSEPTATTPDVSVRRKRAHGLDEEFPSELMIQAKRQKQEASSIEEELLLSHRLLDCLQETDQSDLVLLAGSGGRSQLLTDKDPLLGGDEGLCDTAALMRDIFSSRPPDASPSLAAMT